MQYLFIFGNTPHLSHAELSVFFPSNQLIVPDVALVEGDLDAEEWILRLGGTVKIAKVTAVPANITVNGIAKELFNKQNGLRLGGRNDNTSRLSFGISSYSKDFRVQTAFLQQVKDKLTARGKSSRFVVPKDGNTLSSVVVAKQELIELIVVGKEGEWTIAQTIAVQDFEEWNRRDYSRPEADPKGGMLPPKVARMAVNIASCQLSAVSCQQRILLDPFCGMGTILGEALLSGWTVIGSDQSQQVIEKARKNIVWLENQNYEFFVCDATHISEKIPPDSIDAIVTEPFMGSTEIGDKRSAMSDMQKKVINTIKGLEKLYIGCFKDWLKTLKPGGKIVIALPEYAVSGRTFVVKKVVDKCEMLGYTLLAGPITYSRPQAIVRRKFFVFQKK